MNLNDLAVRIARREGKHKSVDIAQIKEILKIVLDELSVEYYKDPIYFQEYFCKLYAKRREARKHGR